MEGITTCAYADYASHLNVEATGGGVVVAILTDLGGRMVYPSLISHTGPVKSRLSTSSASTQT
jgi:hypothetical protein